MKRLYIILFGFLLPLYFMAQTNGYNPSNPPNPNWPVPDTTTYYDVICEAIPNGAGQFSSASNSKYAAGKKVTITAYNHDNCYFKGWKDAEGNDVTTDKSYSFTMPAHNVTYYALYTYNPSSPGNPVYTGAYMLTLLSQPSAAGTFNFKNQKVTEGSTQQLQAYCNSGFKFLYWKDENGNIVGSQQSLKYLMPSHASTLTAVYDYDPSTPGNPGTNYWDKTSGEAIMDNFRAGYLTSSLQNLVGSGNYTAVTHLIVDGSMTVQDFSFANYFTQCTKIDLSRIGGVTYIPSYTWDGNTALQEIEIPDCISSIQSYAFRNCTSLKSFNCYATVPPSLGTAVFSGVSSDMVIYVPESSVDLYKATDGWNNFTILPLLSKVCTLEINLPSECADGRYKNMALELINVKSGQKYKYVITDRLNYTFGTLVRDTKYKAFLKNLSNQIIAESDTITMDEETVSRTLSKLKNLQSVVLQIVTPDNTDVTDDVAVTWTDSKGSFLSKGSRLDAQIAGYAVSYSVVLPQDLGLKYLQPADAEYEIQESENIVKLTLQPFAEYVMKGKVENSLSGVSIRGATVSITQTLNGKYSDALTTATDVDGSYTISIHGAPSAVTVSANDFADVSFEISEQAFASAQDGIINNMTTKLKPLSGIVVNLAFTYQASVTEEQTPETEPYYKDCNNVGYTIYNKTTDKVVGNFSVQYPKIVIPEGVGVGDMIEITCHSKTSEFKDVTVKGIVEEKGTMSVTFPIVKYGALFARFLVTDNTAVEGILYDSKGNLVDHSTYNTNFTAYETELGDMLRHDNQPNFVYFENLADGQYTLITMGQSAYFNSIYSLSDIATAGMEEGVDYVRNDVTVESGKIIALRNVVIPIFNESKYYYTGKNTTFNVNRTDVIAGNYLTLSGKVDFQDAYKQQISQAELVVELPANAKMVEGSVIVGKNISSYEYRDNTVTVPLGDNVTDRVKFCIIPTERGNYTPNAFVRFQLNGKTILQPIGNAAYTVTDLTIWTPPMVSTPAVNIDGNAAAQSEVVVYDGNIVIGTTKALSDGYWSLQTQLYRPANLSMHEISAQVTTPSGLVMKTETRPVEYNERSIQAKTVEMSFFNNAVNRTIWVKFDLEHVTTSSKSYNFESNTEFVFTADLTNNDTTVVNSCIIRVFTNKHNWIELPARYIKNLDRWVAHGKFDMQSIPIGVRVAVDADLSTEIDFAEVDDSHSLIHQEVVERNDYTTTVTSMPEVDNSYKDDDIKTEPEESFNTEVAQQQVENIEVVAVQEPVVVMDVTENTAATQQYTIKFNGADNEGYEFFATDNLQQVDMNQYANDTIVMPTTQQGDTVKVYIGDEGNFVAYNQQTSEVWGVNNQPTGQGGSKSLKARIATDLVTELKNNIKDLEDAVHHVNEYINNTAAPIRTQMAGIADALEDAETLIHTLKAFKDAHPDEVAAVDAQIMAASTNVALLKKHRFELNAALEQVNGYIEIIRNLNRLISYGHYGIQDVNDWQAFIDRILPCSGIDDPQARALSWISEDLKTKHGERYIAACRMASVMAYLLTSNTTNEKGVPMLSFVNSALASYLTTIATAVYQENKAASRNHIRKAKRDRNKFECAYETAEVIDDKWDFTLPYPVVEPIIDPAGYVYEGVSSNRLEGVTATAYYKHTYEDVYGDLQQDIVLWDASQYSQENPLYTDKEGMYKWDVPEGLWQVKYEKEGYVTAYSDWLPVPPPQMDVNIGMVQNAQPEVLKARAYESSANAEGGVEITFNKYMKPSTLNAGNIFIKGIKGTDETFITDVAFSYPDEEETIEGSSTKYATKVFVKTGQLNIYDEIYVMVNRNVESYAGINMTENYQQKIDIEKRIDSIAVDSVLDIAYDGKQTVMVGLLPTEAAAGKKITVTSSSSLIATVGEEAASALILTLDENGQAALQVNGALYGTTALQFEVVDEELTAVSKVNVVDASMLMDVKAPLASRISGTAVYRGQVITLSCESEGATIYYTTDGTCPCESATRKLYENPITINDATTLKIMSVGFNGMESEVKEYHYTIRQSAVAVPLAKGWNWISHDQASPYAVSHLQDVATKVLTQQYAATHVDAATSIKVNAKADASISFTGDQYNPTAQEIMLSAGWNWLGYPLDVTLSLNDAFSYLAVQDGDIIASLEDGFAVCDGGKWQGTIDMLKPGQGYMYKSASQKAFVYNTVPTANAKALYGHRLPKAAPLTADKHAAADMMCILADVVYEGNTIADSSFLVYAFVGEECRGAGHFVGNRLFLPVCGNDTEEITFKAFKADTGESYDILQTCTFHADALGSMAAPYTITIANPTGIQSVKVNDKAGSKGVYTIDGRSITPQSARHGIYIINGRKKAVK